MSQPAPAKPEFKPAGCPLLTAVIPLRYAIGPTPSLDVGAMNLPPLNGNFPELGDKNAVTRGKPLNYVARFLRNGYLYVWQTSPAKLVEFTVENTMLQETARGGKVIDKSKKPYLMLPAGTPAMLVWSPTQWTDQQFAAAKSKASTRTRVMRAFTPGAAPASGKAEGIYDFIGDYKEPEGFQWSCESSTKNAPKWQPTLVSMKRCEQQAYVIADDAWGVWKDLAAMTRARQAAFDDLRQKRSDDWAIAGALKSLSENDSKIKQELPSMTRHAELLKVWKEQETEESGNKNDIRRITQLWSDWLQTFNTKGPSTLDTAAGHYDITQSEARAELEKNFAAACLGPAGCSISAKALAVALDPEKGKEGHSWLIWSLLGLSQRMGLAELKSLLDISDSINDNGAAMANAASSKVKDLFAAINKVAHNLASHTPAPILEALFLSLAPVAGNELHDNGKPPSTLARIYMGAAMARSGQRIETVNATPKQIGEWLSDLMGTRPAVPSKKLKLTPVASAVQDALPFFILVPAKTTGAAAEKLASISEMVAPETNLRNLLNLSKDSMDKAPAKCVVALMAAINFGYALKQLIDKRSAKGVINLVGAGVGLGAATAAVWQKVAEINWETAVKSSGSNSSTARIALADALGFSWKAAGLQSVVSAFDIVVYGIEAFESYQDGDFNTSAINAGLSVASAANLAIYVQTFRTIRAARAAVIFGEATAVGRGVSQAPHLAFKAVGITIIIVGGVIARLYTQDTPLEKWVKGTRFGISPADWSKTYAETMTEFYKIVFPISFDAYRLNELNPYRGMVESTYLMLKLPGKTEITDNMILFEGEEIWGGIFGYGSKREKVTWTGDNFDRHEGTRVANDPGVATYRRVYHTDREGRALNRIRGQLTYSPLEGVSLPPIEIKDIAWL
ncbi:PT-TG domain-containing protein [Pseudomonas sp. IT-P100]|uniref:toxin VasX n=1 Tax=Pseudomonas sp. IT-P100 TaxID=3026452 RepID=UPI0039E1C3EC